MASQLTDAEFKELGLWMIDAYNAHKCSHAIRSHDQKRYDERLKRSADSSKLYSYFQDALYIPERTSYNPETLFENSKSFTIYIEYHTEQTNK